MRSKFWLDKDGYAIVNKRVNGKTKHFRLHRLIVEENLGRKLFDYEIVHHKDGIKLNNAIENLEVVENRSEHISKYHKNVWNKGKVTLNNHYCEWCGDLFTTVRQPKRRYCGASCSSKYANSLKKKRFCTVDGCERKHAANGFCHKHYYRYYYRLKSWNKSGYKNFL